MKNFILLLDLKEKQVTSTEIDWKTFNIEDITIKSIDFSISIYVDLSISSI